MAPSPGTCAVAGMHPQRLRLRLLLAIAAGIAAYIDAARLDRLAHDASTANGLMGAATNELASAQAKPPGVDKGDRDHDLRLLAGYVDSLNPNHPMSLSEIRVQATHLERVRSRVCNLFRDRDGRNRQMVRSILSNIRLKTDAFNRVAARKESEGELDDGGDVFPSLRDNICSGIDDHSDCDEFREQLRDLCKALDSVRAAVLAGEDHQAAVFEVNGRLAALRIQKEYAQSSVNWGVAVLLGEEWRWVTKQLARRSLSEGEHGDSKSAPKGQSTPQLADLRKPGSGIDSWLTDVLACSHQADPAIASARLQEAEQAIRKVVPEQHDSLSALYTSLDRLEIHRELLAEFVTCVEPALHEQIRKVLRMIKAKTDALEALADIREAAGEEDDLGDAFPSQRDNICSRFEDYGLAPELREIVRDVCEALDKMREATNTDGDTEAAVMRVLGRLQALQMRPGYGDMPFAGEIEHVFAEEWRWMNSVQCVTESEEE
eukprot:CAMPEP_0170289896 /NCGR_PEP_ID=MMETSP0116_2-20130129/45022_1 /TAXON_ID=400756 /ORGANISM="Durinskia baltica, Strain CSIRO CS-38" /LENGTH=489 /DNA_ID=CAMNT_0010541347 /DNA_START=123 /DNA_END=1592 /DNA_ORIENTATION=-